MAKAAAQFRVKQPSVSATITFLEVAMKLFHRRRFLRLAAGAMRTLAVVLALLVASGVAQIAAVQAADINAFISTAIKAVTDELLPPFERANGHSIRASYAPSGALLPRFERGEPVDVFLTDAPAIDRLIQQGKIVGGRIDLARTGIGICVRKGAPRPDVSTPEALKRALLGAKTVGHASPAGGSIVAAHIQGVFERLGIAAQVTPKVKLAAGGPNGRVSVLVSSGEAEIGLQQVSELMSNPEVEVVGMLPAELQLTTLYSAAVTASARQAEAAMSLIRVLTVPTAAPIFKAAGLDPAR
jgi:molybdate transport system substrate-binding protein